MINVFLHWHNIGTGSIGLVALRVCVKTLLLIHDSKDLQYVHLKKNIKNSFRAKNLVKTILLFVF